jgi:ubiquinone/menaquinone biosynthesis C-methylase UbiE
MLETTDMPIGIEGLSLEGGFGHGKDTVRLASSNPKSTLIAIDPSKGANVTASRLRKLGIGKVIVIRASLLNIPLRNDIITWVFSFGVLHHTPNPSKCMSELSGILKRGGTLAMYLYSDLTEFPINGYN